MKDRASAAPARHRLLLWLLPLTLLAQVPLPWTGLALLLALLQAFFWRPRRAVTPLGARVEPQALAALAAEAGQLWLGWGGDWRSAHSAALHQHAEPADGLAAAPARQQSAGAVQVPARLLARNVLALGAPGSGKSSLLVLLVWQAQQRGEAVVVIDPKGSHALRTLLAAGARRAQVPLFCLDATAALPAVRYDPFRHCLDAAACAERLSALLGDARYDPFREFSRGALTTVCEALLACGEHPSLGRLAQLMPEAGASLLAQLDCPDSNPGRAPELLAGMPAADAVARRAAARAALAALLAHDRSHYRKMCAPLLPLLALLGSGRAGRLLAAPAAGESAVNLDPWRCRAQGATLLVALDALAQPTLTRALAALLIDDLARESGQGWRGAHTPRVLQLMVDEAGEVVCEPLLRLLGKGREAEVRVLVAVQTLADLEWRLGSRAAARVAEGNAAAWFLFRQLDADSRAESEARLGSVRLECPERSFGQAESAGRGGRRSSRSLGQTRRQQTLPRVPAATFAALRDFECLAQLPDGQLLHLRLPRPTCG